MKDEILHNEKSYTDEDSNEFYTGAIVPAGFAILPVDTIDLTGNETTAQTDAQEDVSHALGLIIPDVFLGEGNDVLPWPITTEQIDAQENVDHALGLILPDDIVEFIGEGNDVLPWPMTTAQIDAHENVNYALGLIIPDGSDKTPAPTDEQGNVGIVPISANVTLTILEPGGSGLYIDNPETGLRSLQIDQNPAPTSQITSTPSHVQAEDVDSNVQKIIDFYKQHAAESSTNPNMPLPLLLSPNPANANANANEVDADLQKIIDYYKQYADNSQINNDGNAMPNPIASAPEKLIATYKSIATKSDDLLIGADKNEKLSGLAGNDTLDGALGDDILDGGAGNDVLIGSAGKDKLTGGAGADTFKFASANESTFWSMDTITDFKHAQSDKIDLSGIDSNANLAGDQGFALVSAFSADATGQLYFDVNTHILYGSTDADSAPEFAITLNGVSTLVAADFIF